MTIEDEIDITVGRAPGGYAVYIQDYRVAGSKPYPFQVGSCKTTYREIARAFTAEELRMMLDFKSK